MARGCKPLAPGKKMRLTESDLKFIVETVATRRRDHDHIIGLVRDKEDLLDPMLEDPTLAERLVNEKEVFVRVSPYLMFAVLLRRVRRDLEPRSFMFERDARGKRIPVFEAPQAVQLLGDPAMREYPDRVALLVRPGQYRPALLEGTRRVAQP